MSASRNEVEELRHSAELREVERLYRSVVATLGSFLTRRYGLSDAEATALVEEAFYAYLQATAPASEPESWLVSIICSRAETLHRNRDGEAEAAGHEEHDARAILSSPELLRLLPHNAQQALHLRFEAGWTYEDIGAELQIPVRYAKHLVITSLKKLRDGDGE